MAGTTLNSSAGNSSAGGQSSERITPSSFVGAATDPFAKLELPSIAGGGVSATSILGSKIPSDSPLAAQVVTRLAAQQRPADLSAVRRVLDLDSSGFSPVVISSQTALPSHIVTGILSVANFCRRSSQVSNASNDHPRADALVR